MFVRGFPLHFQGKKSELPVFQGLLFSFSISLVKIAVVWGTGGFSFFLLTQSYLDLRKGTVEERGSCLEVTQSSGEVLLCSLTGTNAVHLSLCLAFPCLVHICHTQTKRKIYIYVYR